METHNTPIKGKNKGHLVFRNIYKLVAVLAAFAIVLVGCSKGDDPADPTKEVDETTENNGNTGEEQEIGVTVTLKSMVPESPAALKFGEDVEVTFDYDVVRSDGARIWVYPFSDGNNSPKYKYELSPKYSGKGTKTVRFSITEGDSVVVDQIKIQIGTGGYTLLGTVFWDPLETIYESVNYTFTN